MSALKLSNILSFSFACISSETIFHTLQTKQLAEYYHVKKGTESKSPSLLLLLHLLDTPEPLASDIIFVGIIYFFYSSVAESQFSHPVHSSAHPCCKAQICTCGSCRKAICSKVVGAGQRQENPQINKRQQATFNHHFTGLQRIGQLKGERATVSVTAVHHSPRKELAKQCFILFSSLVP